MQNKIPFINGDWLGRQGMGGAGNQKTTQNRKKITISWGKKDLQGWHLIILYTQSSLGWVTSQSISDSPQEELSLPVMERKPLGCSQYATHFVIFPEPHRTAPMADNLQLSAPPLYECSNTFVPLISAKKHHSGERERERHFVFANKEKQGNPAPELYMAQGVREPRGLSSFYTC